MSYRDADTQVIRGALIAAIAVAVVDMPLAIFKQTVFVDWMIKCLNRE